MYCDFYVEFKQGKFKNLLLFGIMYDFLNKKQKRSIRVMAEEACASDEMEGTGCGTHRVSWQVCFPTLPIFYRNFQLVLQ